MKWKTASMNTIIPRCLILFSVFITAVGCAPSNYSIKPGNITPEQITIAQHQKGSVVLKVDGGWDKTILGLQLMPNAAVMDALKAALEKSGLFEKISADGQGDFRLEAFIFDINQPLLGGGDTNVLVEIAWTLSRLDSGDILWRESIETSHTTKADAAFGLYARVNLSAEAATKENIKTALERISKIPLQ